MWSAIRYDDRDATGGYRMHSLHHRRDFLVASTAGLAGLGFARGLSATPTSEVGARLKPAKSTILFFLCGGASHIDMWDLKPLASNDYRGPFQPIETSARGLSISEHLPRTAKLAHHLALVHGVTDFGRATGDHHAGYYYNLTGHVPDNTFRTQGNDRRPYRDDWPFMGSVIGSRRPAHKSLPQVITLPHKPSRAPYTRPGQFAARLGIEHDPFYLYGSGKSPLKFSAPAISLSGSVSKGRLAERRQLLHSLDRAKRKLDQSLSIRDVGTQQEKAFGLLASAKATDAFNIEAESKKTRERYGETINGMSLLMARRLVEAGVPFVTVFWKENEKIKNKCRSAGGWDTHGNNFNCLKQYLLPEFDRAYSALISDLAEKQLLDDTLVLVSSEMGRKPKIGDPRSGGVSGAGRDHWTACMSNVLAGGGIRGGQIYGETDKRAEYPTDRPVDPADVVKTVYHAMGITNLSGVDREGRQINLLEGGKAIRKLF